VHELTNKYDKTPYLGMTTTWIVRALTAATTRRREREEGLKNPVLAVGSDPLPPASGVTYAS
jgi:hypothetical protein